MFIRTWGNDPTWAFGSRVARSYSYYLSRRSPIYFPMASTPVRQWTPGKGTGAMMAADEAAMMELEEKQDKRQLTPAKTPDREAKKAHTTETRTKEEETATDVEEMTLLKSDLHNLIMKQQVQENQILYALKTHADQDRLKCASEALAINWMKYKKVTRLEDEYTHRERIIEWCLKEAGISSRFWPAQREYSHQVKADHISAQTHLKLSQPWIRKKLLAWQKDKYPKGIPEWWTPEEAQTLGEKSELNSSSNGMLFFKPQIPIWDRIKGIPMRTAMTVLKEIFEYKDFTPTWPERHWSNVDYLQFIQRHCKSPYRPKHWFWDLRRSLPVQVCELQHPRESTKQIQGKRQEQIPDTHRRRRGKVPFYLPVQAGDRLGQGVWGLQVWEPHWSRRIGNAGGSRKMATLIHEHRKRTHDEGSKKQFTNHEINTLYASLL